MLKQLYDNKQAETPEDPIVEEPGTEEEEVDYEFTTGALPPHEKLAAFLEEFNEEKEDTGAQEEPEPEDELPGDPEDPEVISNTTAKNTAYFIVGTVDELASKGLAQISGDPAEKFKAGKEQRKNLETLFTHWCKEKGTKIPIGWQIAICLGTVYLAQIPYALNRRKFHEEEKKLENKLKEIENREAAVKRREEEADEQFDRIQRIKTSLNQDASES